MLAKTTDWPILTGLPNIANRRSAFLEGFLERGMTLEEYENGGRTLYAELAETVAAILQAAVNEHDELRLQTT